MRVGEEEHEPVARQLGRRRHPVPHVVHLCGPQQAVIEGHDDLELVRGMRVLQVQHRCGQRPVDAGRAIVRGRAPHAMVDSHGRRDVAARHAGQQTALR